MTYYPAWFDYAKWTFVVCGGLCWFSMLTEVAGRKRGLLKLAACVLIAVGMAFGGLAGVLFNLRASHLNAEGTLFGVLVAHGKGSHSDFGLRFPSDKVVFLSMSGAYEQLSDGETARVTYQDGTHRVLRVKVLEGRNAGFDETASDGFGGSCVALLLSLCLGGYGVLDWINDGTAATPSDPDNNQRAPDGDVDTKSMLDLS
jgi:hypothetical protein